MDHMTALTLFSERRETERRFKEKIDEGQVEHDFPFKSTKPLDPISINEKHVVMSRKTGSDFEPTHKLELQF